MPTADLHRNTRINTIEYHLNTLCVDCRNAVNDDDNNNNIERDVRPPYTRTNEIKPL